VTRPNFDVDLASWLDGIGFHPANTEIKQLAHETVRRLVAELGTTLHQVLPAGKDKSIAFTALEDVLMRANRQLAISSGPKDEVRAEDLHALMQRANVVLPEDDRIDEYKEAQLRPANHDEREERQRTTGVTGDVDEQTATQAAQLAATGPDGVLEGEEQDDAYTAVLEGFHPAYETRLSAVPGHVQIGTVCSDGELLEQAIDEQDFAGFFCGFDERDAVEELAASLLTAANRAFGPKQ
jgi:hypothetical protein